MRTAWALSVSILTALAACAGAAERPNNPVGVHLMIHDARTDANIANHTAWARRMAGPWGYAKIFEYGITPATPGPAASQVKLIETLYEREMIPVVRLGGQIEGGIWQKPADTPDGTYRDIAEAFKRVVAGYPLSDECPLYIEVWNEPNLGLEWSGMPKPAEFAKFYVRCFKAIRSIGDPRILISPGAMSPGGQYESLRFIDACCKAEPEFVRSFDYWATHPYPGATPPWVNAHDDPDAPRYAAIDLWVHELKVLEANGRDVSDLKVIGTETGYRLGHGGGKYPLIDSARRADYHLRTIRDHWMQYPEVLGMCLWEWAEPFQKETANTWVHADSRTAADGWPSRPTRDYEYIAALAKPTTDYACVSGKLLDQRTGAGVPGIVVGLENSDITFTTDRFGNYLLSPIPPTKDRRRKVTYRSASHGNGSFTFEAEAGQNVVIDRNLEAVKFAHLRGYAMNSATGRPLPGAEVSIEPGHFRIQATSIGLFEFQDIPHGYYDISVEKRGFIPHRQIGVFLPADRMTEMKFHLGPGTPVEDNMLTNGSFEGADEGASTALGWGGANVALDDEVRYVGNRSQRLTAHAGQVASLIQWTAYTSLEAGRRYRMQCWARTKGVRAEEGKGLRLTGTVVTNPHEHLEDVAGEPVTGDTDWQLLTVEFTAPKDAGRVSCEIVLDADAGEAWVDQAAVYEID